MVLLDGGPAACQPLARRGSARGAAAPLRGGWLGRLIVTVESGGGVDEPLRSTPQGFTGSASEGAEAAQAEVAAGSHERQPSVEVDAEAVEDRGEVGGDGSSLVAAHDAPGLVHQCQVFVQRDGGGEGAVVRLVDGGAGDGRDPQTGFRRGCRPGQGGDQLRGAVFLSGDAALLHAGVVAGLGRLRHGGADRIEINVGHGGDDGGLVEQRHALEASLPEVPSAAIVAVGAAGEAFLHALHEPGERPQALADGIDPLQVGGPLRDFGGTPRLRAAVRAGARMRARPARGDLDGRPTDHAVGIGQDDDVQVVGHHGVGQHVDGEGACRLADEFADPGAAVLGAVAAEVGTANAAGDEVIGAWAGIIDQA